VRHLRGTECPAGSNARMAKKIFLQEDSGLGEVKHAHIKVVPKGYDIM
jgi:hypothetical protein